MRERDVVRTYMRIAAEVIWIKMLINPGEHALFQIKFLSQFSAGDPGESLIQRFIFLNAAAWDEP